MIAITRQIIFIELFLFPFLVSAKVQLDNAISDFQSYEQWTAQIKQIRYESPDSAIQFCQQSYEFFIAQKDTLSAVRSLVEKAAIYGHKANYQSAYDNLWKALLLADFSIDERSKAEVYINLGRYYSFYKREEKAVDYFQRVLNISRALEKETEWSKANLAEGYYALCSTYRELNKPNKAKIYLDSCLIHGRKMNPYLKFEEAYIKNATGKHREALDIMLSIQSWMENNSPGYQVLLFAYTGDAHLALEDMDSAETYYKKSLAVADQYKSHLDFIPTVYERLSNLYQSKGDFQKAFINLQKMKELDLQFFDSRSPNNRSLLEIKDEFRLEKEKQKQLIQQQRLAALEHQER
ncbi:MAG: tetratricopeptide repeat protein, partial [Bacteroidota bacterium]